MLVSRIGFGAFKIGRNQGAKYPNAYDLPSDEQIEGLFESLLEMGINYIDTAPAYGRSEQLVGRATAGRRDHFVISTKVGEVFEAGHSTHDFSANAVRQSIERSLGRLKTEVLDLVFIHSNGEDLQILHESDAVATLQQLQQKGCVRAIGFSGKTIEGTVAALSWADAIMVEYSIGQRDLKAVITEAAKAEIAVMVKKGLGSGQLPPTEAIRFVLANHAVTSLLIGSLNIDHMRENVAAAPRNTSV